MLRSYAADDIYRVMLGADRLDTLSRTLNAHAVPAEGPLRLLRRDDGSDVWVVVALIDGDTLERLSLLQQLSLIQIDNISARLRQVPTRTAGGAMRPSASSLCMF